MQAGMATYLKLAGEWGLHFLRATRSSSALIRERVGGHPQLLR